MIHGMKADAARADMLRDPRDILDAMVSHCVARGTTGVLRHSVRDGPAGLAVLPAAQRHAERDPV